MILPPDLPNLSVAEGARRLALARLDDVATARTGLVGNAGPDALHDYRVALRQLRSCLRAYVKPLRSSVARETTRRLRRLAHATNRPRDLEVHLAWLEQQRERADEAARPGMNWLFERLTADRERAHQRMLRLDQRLYPRIRDRLAPRLTRFRATFDLDAAPERRSTAGVTGRRIRAAARRLKQDLARIQGYSSEDAIHRARISAKRLRYLLEPFAAAVPQGQGTVERLKQLQDGFGDVHDAHVFGAELREAIPAAEQATEGEVRAIPGLDALMEALQVRGQHAFGEAAAGWLGGAAEPFFSTVDAVAEAVTRLADRDREVERKFLLTA